MNIFTHSVRIVSTHTPYYPTFLCSFYTNVYSKDVNNLSTTSKLGKVISRSDTLLLYSGKLFFSHSNFSRYEWRSFFFRAIVFIQADSHFGNYIFVHIRHHVRKLPEVPNISPFHQKHFGYIVCTRLKQLFKFAEYLIYY